MGENLRVGGRLFFFFFYTPLFLCSCNSLHLFQENDVEGCNGGKCCCVFWMLQTNRRLGVCDVETNKEIDRKERNINVYKIKFIFFSQPNRQTPMGPMRPMGP